MARATVQAGEQGPLFNGITFFSPNIRGSLGPGVGPMLELPEVLTLSRQLDRELRGKTIASAGRGNSPHRFAFFKPSEREIAKTLARRKVAAVRGDGKYITFDLKPRALFSIAEMDG